MKILIDMNLSPEWVALFLQNGHEALHWSSIGRHNAPDSEIMQWARNNRAIVFTHDLDFGILLSHTQAGAPSVVQIRAQNVTPEHLGAIVLEVLSSHRGVIEAGALITVDEARARVRILPV